MLLVLHRQFSVAEHLAPVTFVRGFTCLNLALPAFAERLIPNTSPPSRREPPLQGFDFLEQRLNLVVERNLRHMERGHGIRELVYVGGQLPPLLLQSIPRLGRSGVSNPWSSEDSRVGPTCGFPRKAARNGPRHNVGLAELYKV
jgi:hypothetical protein